MPPKVVTRAYGERADEYARHLGAIDATHPADRELVATWGKSLRGTVIDVGCGPGHWTAYLDALGCNVSGLDPVARFIEIATEAHPEVSYRQGSFDDLAPASADGLFSWYSIIHMDATDVERTVRQCHAALNPTGTLLIGFFDGLRCEQFDHEVAPAYFWPLHELKDLLETTGFSIIQTTQRHDPGRRPHGAIIAGRA